MNSDSRKCGIKCAVAGCKSSSRQNIRLFRLTNKNPKYNEWVSNCNLQNIDLKYVKICEKHFEPQCFPSGKLKQNSVPTIFSPSNNISLPNYNPPAFSLSTVENNRESSSSSSNVTSCQNQNNICRENKIDDDGWLRLTVPVRTYSRSDATLKSDINYIQSQDNSYNFEQTIKIKKSIFNNEENSLKCGNCLKNIKNETFYRLKYYKILKTLEYKNKQIALLKRKCKTNDQKIKRNKIKCLTHHKPALNINNHIDNLTINENAKQFSKILLNVRPKSQKWPDEQRAVVQNIYYRSSGMYKYLRENLKFNLPSKSSLVRWQPIKYLSPGFNENMLQKIKQKLIDMPKESREAVLLFDEIYIKADLKYNIYSDQIDGFIDFGLERENLIGKIIGCFMIRAISSNWKFILSYFVSQNGIPSEKLNELIMANLDKSKNLGLNIRAIICDQGPTNRKAFKTFGVTADQPFFKCINDTIFCIYDAPHLIKSVRNVLLKSNLKSPDGVV